MYVTRPKDRDELKGRKSVSTAVQQQIFYVVLIRDSALSGNLVQHWAANDVSSS